jgi:hypothetical protein
MMTPEQQALALRACEMVPTCVRLFWQHFPCLRNVAKSCDLESVAYLACCRAAITYDPSKAGMSAYFSVAIRHGMQQEVEKEVRSRSHSIDRIPLAWLDQRQEPARREDTHAFAALAALDADLKEWLEKIALYPNHGGSARQYGKSKGVCTKTAGKMIAKEFRKLRKVIDDQP